jgi:hypothetical protein
VAYLEANPKVAREFLKAQASNDRFTVTVQGTQGFKRNNVAFTVFVNVKKGEAAA